MAAGKPESTGVGGAGPGEPGGRDLGDTCRAGGERAVQQA